VTQGIDYTITLHGPVFRTPMPDHIRDAVSKGIDDLLAEGEDQVIRALHSEGPYDGKAVTPAGNRRVVTGHYQRSINGKKTADLAGKIHDSNVVYGPWLEGVSSRNDRTRFKGYHAFRRAQVELDRKAEPIFQKRIRDAVDKLGGGL